MAVVILGGLFTSTVLNLFVMPALSLRYAKDPRFDLVRSRQLRTGIGRDKALSQELVIQIFTTESFS
jgi:hypothetical protein